MISNKNGCARIKKLIKTLMEFFQKFSILTENLVDFDVTCSVMLGTVPHSSACPRSYWMLPKMYFLNFS